MDKEKEIIEMAIANFSNIEKIAERLTPGNVSHDGNMIRGIAHRNVAYLREVQAEMKPDLNTWRKFDNQLPASNTHILRRITPGILPRQKVLYYVDFWNEERIWNADDCRANTVYEWKYIDTDEII